MRKEILVALSTVGLLLGCVPKRVPPVDEEVQRAPAARTPAPVEPGVPAAAQPSSVVVYFELDSAALQEEARRALAGLALEVRKQGPVAIEVEGHTCEFGTEEYNLVLGNKRAESARGYLRELGVDERLLSAVSYGELRPLAPGALSRNRRAEVKVTPRGRP